MIILIILYIIIVSVLLYVSYTHKLFSYYTLLKALASGLFLAMGISKAVSGAYATFMLCAMVACLFGDVLLGLANNLPKLFTKFFISGIGSFIVAHILFSIGFTQLVPLNWFDLFLSVFGLCFTLVLSMQKGFRFSRMKKPAMFYSLFVGLVCARGISVFVTLGTRVSLLMAVGTVMFLISDALILFLYFTVKKPRRMIRVLNLLTYYIAMICLALSL